jgi:hypothetical protein
MTGSVQNYTGPLYVTILQTATGIDPIAPPVISGNGASTWVTPRSAQTVGYGYYRDTITVSACSDINCTNQLSGSPRVIDVDYTVVLGTLPKQLSFTASAGVTPAAQTVIFSIHDRAKNWASSYQYLDAVTGWLNYTPASGTGGPMTITVQPIAVPNTTPAGTYRANIIFGADAGALRFTLPISYTIR